MAAMRGSMALLGWTLLAVLAAPGLAPAESSCTHHAAPLSDEGGRAPAGGSYGVRGAAGSAEAPFAVSDFWELAHAVPGAVLCLHDGLYRGEHSMLALPEGLAGKAGSPIEIRALEDGEVWIDGQHERATLRVRGGHWSLSGLNVYDGVGAVVAVEGRAQTHEQDQVPVSHVVLRRIVAWRDYVPYGSEADYEAIGGADAHVFEISDATDVLVEDCAGFGWGRRIFENHRSQRVTFRRNWARWDGRYPYERGNKFAFACSNEGYDALCENLIATAGGSEDEASAPASYSPKIRLVAALGSADRSDRWLSPAGRDVDRLGVRVLGSLAYTLPDARYGEVGGFQVGGAGYPNKGRKDVAIEHAVAVVPGQGQHAFQLHDCADAPDQPDGCSWRGDERSSAPLRVAHVTAVSASGEALAIGKDWSRQDVVERPSGGQIDPYRGTDGAGGVLCRRIVDGRQTLEPLWPWPMQDRILAATESSNWPTADVMDEVTELFGPPPPACTR